MWELGIVNRLTQEFDLLLQEGIEGALSDMGEVYTRVEVDASLNVFAWKRWPPLNSNFGTGLRLTFEISPTREQGGNNSTQNWNGGFVSSNFP